MDKDIQRQALLAELRGTITECVFDTDALDVDEALVEGGVVVTFESEAFSPRLLEAKLTPKTTASYRQEGCSSESDYGPDDSGGSSLTLLWNPDEGWGVFADISWPPSMSSGDDVLGHLEVIAATPNATRAWAQGHLESIAKRTLDQTLAEFDCIPREHLHAALDALQKRASELVISQSIT